MTILSRKKINLIISTLILFCAFFSHPVFAAEDLLYDAQGNFVAYIDPLDEFTMYSSTGTPLAYVDNGGAVYGFNGEFLGWYTNGTVWDKDGYMVAFVDSSAPASVDVKIVSEFDKNKKPKPSKMEKQSIPVQLPSFTYQLSPMPFNVIYIPNE